MSDASFFDLDLTYWREALERTEVEEGNYRLSPLVGPLHMAMLERYRRSLGIESKPAGRRDTDIFLMSLGVPPRRDLTQFGGLPYRPADEPWPTRADGTPLRFLAQMRFRESSDILSIKPPGDILLLFCSPNIIVDDWKFEWRTLDIPESELIAGHVDTSGKPPFLQCYGHRFRTFDPPTHEVAQEIGDFLILPATKIGGAISGTNMFNMPVDRHFATLSSICPMMRTAFPWLNVSDPIFDYSYYYSLESICLYDGFSANLFFDYDNITIEYQYEMP